MQKSPLNIACFSAIFIGCALIFKLLSSFKTLNFEYKSEFLGSTLPSASFFAAVMYVQLLSILLINSSSALFKSIILSKFQGLISKDLEGAFLGLGSTYRALGNYEKAKETFLRAISIFPDNHAMKTFYAMTLYNLNEHDKAMEILLTSLINTTSDPTILQYEKALRFYSYQLDKTWS